MPSQSKRIEAGLRWADFDALRRSAAPISNLRRFAWNRVQEHLKLGQQAKGLESLDAIQRVCILASSSRGGTSVTAELLQWQSADCEVPTGRMLSLPGEEKPHLILSGLGFPTSPQMFDDLTAEDTTESSMSNLLSELASEIGYPVARCTDLYLYAIQLYRRMLMQWPLQMLQLEQGSAIEGLALTLRRTFGSCYHDSIEARRAVLDCCIDCFPFVRGSFYDCSNAKNPTDLAKVEMGAWSFEETPFVLPPPWHNATENDIGTGILLLRDPSNAWRLRFWRAVFPYQPIVVLHLVRDARESIQGLCDGWNYPFGFQTLPSDARSCIRGYTDSTAPNATWKRIRLNFSIDRSLRRHLLADKGQMTLVEVCGHQWRAAHEQIQADAEITSMHRVILPFSALRADPVFSFNRMCAAIGIEASRSGIAYARGFSSRWVMATIIGSGTGHERWRHSPYRSEISRVVETPEFQAMSQRLLPNATFARANDATPKAYLVSRSPLWHTHA